MCKVGGRSKSFAGGRGGRSGPDWSAVTVRDGAEARLDLEATMSKRWVELAVLHPKAAKRFAESLRRSKTDRADAVALAEYSRRMKFAAWQPPCRTALELRSITRLIRCLRAGRTILGCSTACMPPRAPRPLPPVRVWS